MHAIAVSSRTLSDEASSAVNAGRVELDEFQVLERESGTSDHGVSITRASMRARAAEVGASVAAGGENGLVRSEAMKRAVLHVQCHDTDALAALHNEIEGEVLDEEVGVVAERLAIERVEESVSGTISGSSAAVGLATLAVLEGLTTKSALVDLAFLSTGEWHTIVLELDTCQTRILQSRPRTRTSITVLGASRHI